MARHRRDDDPPPATGGAVIQVDTDKVSDFATSVQTNVAGTIDPTAPTVTSALTGIPFGAGNPSQALQAMFTQYEQCLTNMNAQVAALRQCVQIIVDTAAQISADYATADAFAKASTSDIESILRNVTNIVTEVPPTPARCRMTPRFE